MDIAIVKNAVGSLDKLLSQAKDALWQVEAEDHGYAYGDSVGRYEYPSDALKSFLDELHDVLLVVLEAADMPETRASLIEAWCGFTPGEGRRHTIINKVGDLESPALTFLERVIQGLRMTVSEAISSEEAWTLSRLEAMLRDTPGLVHRRQKAPENEHELQKIMHDYLSACFPDFQFNPSIGGTLKTFKPDCGIASVDAAIEFKIVHTKEQVAVAFSGVAEDTAGYKGSKDWRRFYSVIYQAQPFMLESQLRSDLKRIGAATWTPIVVNGPAEKKASKAKKK
jgi:REase_DpnII-MboI